VVTLRGNCAPITTLYGRFVVCFGLPESLTDTVKLYVAAVVGIPESAADVVPGVNVTPAGGVPLEMLQVYGPTPSAPVTD